MPRPNAAQLAYGSCTVIFSTLAMLLLSQTTSGVGIAVIALAALALGLLVAMTVPLPKSASASGGTDRPEDGRHVAAGRASASVRSAAGAEPVAESVHEPANS
ncbi:hypothetical protein ABZ845_22210 [Streptomyces sp. NPDC047022]|uniref:hypothetical protein n=1 Tax=Streptomyces sp. NPDC047022 TaxID=3155737 RepID=UPI0033D8F59F